MDGEMPRKFNCVYSLDLRERHVVSVSVCLCACVSRRHSCRCCYWCRCYACAISDDIADAMHGKVQYCYDITIKFVELLKLLFYDMMWYSGLPWGVRNALCVSRVAYGVIPLIRSHDIVVTCSTVYAIVAASNVIVAVTSGKNRTHTSLK